MPEVRAAILKDSAPDDAAIIPIGDGRALLTSIDFQNAIVDDAALAGAIAARNAMSDLFACGVRPMYADVVLVVPYGDQSMNIGRELMRGVAGACIEDGCAIVGGHTIQGETPVVGLSVTSIAKLDRIKRKVGAQPGNILVLTKPLGTGIAIAARQQGAFGDCDYAGALEVLLQSNRVGAVLGELAGVTAMTDVTGFGLLGHMSEVAESSGVTLCLSFAEVPLLPGVLRAAREGAVPILGKSNLAAYGRKTHFEETLRLHEQLVLCDPQTNGGLLICLRPDEKDEVLATLIANGCGARIIGRVDERRVDGTLVEAIR
jgi:selenide,water dikinase